MKLYKIRDVEKEAELKLGENVIAGTIEVDEDESNVKLIDGWQSVKDYLDAPSIATLTGKDEDDRWSEQEGEVKPGEKGYFQAFRDLLITQGFIIEEIKKEE